MNMEKYKIGILGATGTVGQRFVTLLENHPWFEVMVLAASKNSAGKAFKEAVQNRWILSSKIPQKYENIMVMDVEEDAKKRKSKKSKKFTRGLNDL